MVQQIQQFIIQDPERQSSTGGGLCGLCGQACVEASLPIRGQPLGKSTGWEVGIWTRNLAATVVNVLSCVSGLGMVPAPAGASVAFSQLGSTWGWCPRGTSAHWMCCLEGEELRGEGNCVYREFLCSKENLKWLVGTYWQWDDFQGTSC